MHTSVSSALCCCLTVLLLQASYAPLRLTEYAKPKNIERAREVSFVRHEVYYLVRPNVCARVGRHRSAIGGRAGEAAIGHSDMYTPAERSAAARGQMRSVVDCPPQQHQPPRCTTVQVEQAAPVIGGEVERDRG